MDLDIDGWLRGIGLSRYAENFRANEIDSELLSRLTNDDLRDIGVASLGDREKFLRRSGSSLWGANPPPPLPSPSTTPASAGN